MAENDNKFSLRKKTGYVPKFALNRPGVRQFHIQPVSNHPTESRLTFWPYKGESLID